MLTAASELTPGVSTLQETDGFRAALKPFDSSCSLRVLSERDKDRPRKSAFPGLGGALEEGGDGGMALVEEVQAPGWGTASVPSALPASSLLRGSGPGLPTSSEG